MMFVDNCVLSGIAHLCISLPEKASNGGRLHTQFVK